ncbi:MULTISPECIES: HlyD family secretion protein [Rheinheimera]|uniref:HlyD family secretion protein n=1 Tax=Rheinheimera TaxID=67575 RepID=UPI00104CB8B6|nr:HlyD family efflux transporter periplasmic adaptor subunit [Rheinheimera sp. D18]QBL08086.1 multidrug transporter [Rheinheimera sp. D18]
MLATLYTLLLLSNAAEQPIPLLLTGTLQSADKQTVVSPMSDSWRVQVQWLQPEDQPVKQGDLIAVFDAGNIKAQIEQLKSSIINHDERLNQLKSEHKQKVMEAEYELERRQLLLEKAGIDANVPLANLSAYDYEKYQLELKRSRTEANKAAEQLAVARIAASAALTKQQLQLEQSNAELLDAETQLGQMSVIATQNGTISYGTHPWYGTKIYAGITAQPGWAIAELNRTNSLYIEAWVHETDMPRLQQHKALTAYFDIAPQLAFPLKLSSVARQGEKRQSWGTALYYKAVFTSDNLPIAEPILGMGLLIEVSLP